MLDLKLEELTVATEATENQTAGKKTAGQKTAGQKTAEKKAVRRSLLQSLVSDAAQDASSYIENYDVGRGAE